MVDLGCFALFYRLLSCWDEEKWHLLAAVLPARFLSLEFNYLVNKYLVFSTTARREHPDKIAFPAYLLLCAGIMAASWGLTWLGKITFADAPAVLVKAVVDTLLFFASFHVQKRLIFR